MRRITFDYDNVGGLLDVVAYPSSMFSELKRNYATFISTFQPNDDSQAIAVPMYADGTFQFTEQKEVADNGVYYDTEIAGIIPKLEPVNDVLIEELDRGEWICLIKDNNGQLRLVGTNETPLRFDSGKDTGVTFTSRNNVKFSFKGKCATPSVVLEE